MVTVVALALDNTQPIQTGRDSVGNKEGNAEPYLSLAVFDDVSEAGLREAVGRIASASKRVRIGISGLGIFPNENPVIYASVLASDALLNLRFLYEVLGDLGRNARLAYAPGNWMPHITLKIGDNNSDVANDISVLMKHTVRGLYECSEVLVVTGPPPAVVERYELQHL